MGSSIKSFAVFIIIIGIIAGFLCYLFGNSQYNDNKKYMEYATINGGSTYKNLEDAGNEAYAGKDLKTYGIAGIIGSFFGGLPLYWFGCLFERVEQQKTAIYEIKSIIQDIRSSVKDVSDQNNKLSHSLNGAISDINQAQTSIEKIQSLVTKHTGVESPDQLNEDSIDSQWIPVDISYVNCPNCGMHMSLDYIKARKKCPNCGQKYVAQ